MRLINARTLQLESFDNEAIRPKYAILSHRWLDGQEVTLNELVSQDSQHKSGWRKIQFCCQTAIKDNLSHVWIDTCCIDKTSSAELSEAINSMFNWYRDSNACYVYMDDVKSQSRESFRQSLWFTRAWTLQELLAPHGVRFFDSTFRYISDKHDMVNTLSRITNIPEDALTSPRRMHEYAVAVRMSWSANRRATRVEDIAYSLFGLFQVNLPLLYGEGSRAFLRLQEEIIRQFDDQSIFLWNSTDHDRCPLFATSPDLFASETSLRHATLPEGSAKSIARPFVMTNIGLHIDCYMVRFVGSVWLAVLPYEKMTSFKFHRAKLRDSQMCMFLSPSKDQTNVWYRVKFETWASCNITMAIILAYGLCFWPGIHCSSSREDRDTYYSNYILFMRQVSDRVSYELDRAEWTRIYIKRNPAPAAIVETLYGILLHSPMLLKDADFDSQCYSLIGNFAWSSRQSMRQQYISMDDYDSPVGVFALFPFQAGPAGVLFFDPPRFGLKSLALGLDGKLRPAAVLVTEEADLDTASLYQRTFPFTTLDHFDSECSKAKQGDSLFKFNSILRAAFEEEDDGTIPEHVYIYGRHNLRPLQSLDFFIKVDWYLDKAMGQDQNSWVCRINFTQKQISNPPSPSMRGNTDEQDRERDTNT